ncbi:TonB-dependent receptor plug domain-containing protein [Kineobactrum salinum]|uniref:TonB-dependent receptor plug domain-containing protein n=1 Tax=Kineobactrum salinum TaxID=2708301 RepID=A0A6C0U5E6_9GAMM|nr:TonB-dependent receptor plug domain-containing protein [Kineobactrum salinum]
MPLSTSFRHLIISGTVTACAVGGASSVRAQQLEEVVVTATKRETLLQKTSESLQVLGEIAMSDRGMDDFDSYFLSVPSLSQSDSRGPGNKRYAIRGVQSAGEPLVALYLDDVALLGSPGESLDPGGSQPDLKLWDIQRLEVLKGPQGTLYGSGSGGGSIRIITNKPDMSGFDIAASASMADVSHGGLNKSLSGMLNVPLVEQELAARLTAYSHRDDGYIDEVYLGEKDANYADTDGGRLALLWTPGDRTTIDMMGLYQKTVTGSEFELFDFLGDDSPAAAQLVDSGFDDRMKMATLSLTHTFDQLDLMYTGSYQEREVERRDDQTRFLAYGQLGLPPSDCPESALANGNCLDMMNGFGLGTIAPWYRRGRNSASPCHTSFASRPTARVPGNGCWAPITKIATPSARAMSPAPMRKANWMAVAPLCSPVTTGVPESNWRPSVRPAMTSCPPGHSLLACAGSKWSEARSRPL